ncbi:phage tail protein [Bacillus cereus]|uniref:Phage minor structural protein n=1 Tax=Bacillus cereus (strain VD146) TaxID=1053236 RepID=R8NJX8_BACCX|nr:phage tail protein [Bacillus cereus]EOP46617.1 phage minor structural protein [Bacillus cereus VD146]
MTELLVKGINGQVEMLTDYKDVKRKRRVNGDHSLSFYQLNTERAKDAYKLLDKRAKIIVDDDEYVVIRLNKRGHYGKSIQTIHVFFDDLINTYQYDVLNGYTNFVQCMTFIFAGTGWSWVNKGAFAATRFENFGDDTSLSLLQKSLDRFGAEFQIDNKNKTVTFKNEIGTYTDAQFRYGHNLKTFDEDIDVANFATFIKGFGKASDGSTIEVSYRSPMADVYGVLPQKPVRDERFNSKETLLAECKKIINDNPEVSFKVSITNLIENGLPIHKFGYGDYVYMLYEEADVIVQIRVIEIEDNPTNKNESPVVELSTFKQLKKMSEIVAQFQQTQKQVQQLLDDGGNINLALKRLYANTQMFTDHTGMWMIDPKDPNRYVHHGAGGSDYHKGMIRIERADGYAVMINGILQHGFDIQGSYPPYTSSSVKVEYKWWTTLSLANADCQFYTFEHKSRYLKVHVAMLATEGATSFLTIEEGANQNAKILAQTSTSDFSTSSSIAINGEFLTVDLGVPTGSRKSVYVRLRTSDETKKAYGRIVRMWLEG